MTDKFFDTLEEGYIISSAATPEPSTATQLQNSQMKRFKGSHFLNVTKILFAALPTIVFGVFTIVFTLQQDASAKATRELDQRQADEVNRRIIFKEYIDDMKELLLDENFEQNINRSLLHIRVQTLTVLRHLDADRKHDVILFLYENHLIRHDHLPNVELRGADLTGMKFIKSSTELCDLSFLYLPGIYAENIIFDGCILSSAVFDSALMMNARFHSCIMANSSFVSTNLTQAQFHDNQVYQSNFTSAVLTQSYIKGGVFLLVDLTNVDLYRSNISNQMLELLENGDIAPNILLNTRFSNGSFNNINTDDLIVNGEAQTEVCLTEKLFVLHTFLV